LIKNKITNYGQILRFLIRNAISLLPDFTLKFRIFGTGLKDIAAIKLIAIAGNGTRPFHPGCCGKTKSTAFIKSLNIIGRR